MGLPLGNSQYLIFVLFYKVKIYRNDSFRLNSASKTFGGRDLPDHLEELKGNVMSANVTEA